MSESAWIPVRAAGVVVHPHLRWLGRVSADGPWMFLHAGERLRPVARTKNGRAVRVTCSVYRCRRIVARGTRDRVCSHCKMARWRANHPVENAFASVRDRARKKQIPFELTLAEFRQFVSEAGQGYVEGRGPYVGQLHLDRIDPTRGYVIGNLQVLRAEENSRKGAGEDKKAQWLARRLGITVAELRARTIDGDDENGRDDTMHTPVDEWDDSDNYPF